MKRDAPAALALLFLAATPAPPATAPREIPAAPLDLASLLGEAQRVQAADLAAWRRFRFRRRHTKDYLDDAGRSTETQDRESLVTPAGEVFDELLVRLDGREPTPREAGRHRREAKFSKHYATLLAGDAEDDEEGAYSLGVLLRLASYRYVGREAIDGVPCHRLDFSPDPAKEAGGIAGRFAEAMQGSLWATVDGLHLFRARARTIRPISIALSLSKVHELEVGLDSQAVAPGVFLPRRIEVRTSARILTHAIRQRNVYTYSDFAPVAAPPGQRRAPPAVKMSLFRSRRSVQTGKMPVPVTARLL